MYIQIDPKKVGKPNVYRAGLNESNVHKKQLQRRTAMNTLLQMYIKVRYIFACMTRYIKYENRIGKQQLLIN
jgi:hypothetical protein